MADTIRDHNPMDVDHDDQLEPTVEVDALLWLPAAQCGGLLTHEFDRGLPTGFLAGE